MRPNKRLFYGIVFSAATIAGIGCVIFNPDMVHPVVSHGGPVKDYVSLSDHLRTAGATIEPVGEVSQPFLSVKGQTIRMNGEDVQVFEYPNTAAANREATSISDDGYSVGTTMISWVSDPHFYKIDKLIVLYVGDNQGILTILDQVLGPQIAGK